MRSARPFGLLNKGYPPSERDLGFIKNLVAQLSNAKSLSELESLKTVKELPDGGTVIVQDMGGNLRVITDKPFPKEEPLVEPTGYAEMYIPMLYSGVVSEPISRNGAGIGINITRTTQRRLTNYHPSRQAPKQLELQRFVIEYHQSVLEFKPENTRHTHSQYTAQRPTWYSGGMAELMQIVGGYGKQDIRDLPEEEWERAVITLPEEVAKAIKQEIDGELLPAYSGVPPLDGQYQYDYKFWHTHLVGIGQDKTPWLIEISRRGMFAMPLPMIPATCTAAYREWIEQQGDDEIITILDRFGGLPSGEGFPTGEAFDHWRKAGVIIRLGDLSKFYENESFFPACGWSSNLNATEIVNTCRSYQSGTGVPVSHFWKCNVAYGNLANGGRLKPVKTQLDNQDDNQAIAEYVAQIMQLFPATDSLGLSVRYKVRRANQSDLLKRAKAVKFDAESERRYWAGLEAQPITHIAASPREIQSGIFWHQGKGAPEIKLPLFGHGLISLDFTKTKEGTGIPNPPVMDTVLIAYFIDNDLKTVKFFRDERKFQNQDTDDFEPYMTVGTWHKTKYSSQTGVKGDFYMTDIDMRDELTPDIMEGTYTGKDRGYPAKASWAFDEPWSMTGTLFRHRYFEWTSKEQSSWGNYLDIATCIPMYTRNAVLHAYRDGRNLASKRTWNELKSVQDPWTYRYWTYHRIFAWRGGYINTQKGNPYPVDGKPVWIEEEHYNPSPATDFADRGSWIAGFPHDYTHHIVGDAVDGGAKNGWAFGFNAPAPQITSISLSENIPMKHGGRLDASIEEEATEVHREPPQEWYFTPSPDPKTGYIFYRDACKNVFGDAKYSNVSEMDKANPTVRKYWGKTELADNTTTYQYIGVINE